MQPREFITEYPFGGAAFFRGGADPDPFPRTPFPTPGRKNEGTGEFKSFFLPVATGGA